jgi:transcriptional regulator with XRE-family HTH domain
MPNTRSHYHRRLGPYAFEKQEFQRLIAELNRLALKKGYSQAQTASEIGVSPITVNHWLTGHSLMAQRENIERLKKFLSDQ